MQVSYEELMLEFPDAVAEILAQREKSRSSIRDLRPEELPWRVYYSIENREPANVQLRVDGHPKYRVKWTVDLPKAPHAVFARLLRDRVRRLYHLHGPIQYEARLNTDTIPIEFREDGYCVTVTVAEILQKEADHDEQKNQRRGRLLSRTR